MNQYALAVKTLTCIISFYLFPTTTILLITYVDRDSAFSEASPTWFWSVAHCLCFLAQ